MADRIIFRHDTKENWARVNPILMQGEEGIEDDTKLRKLGDGINAWNDLDYIATENVIDSLGNSKTAAISQNAVNESVNVINTNTGIAEYEEFSEAKAYSIGDTVKYNGLLYTFIAEHEAGAFDEGQVEDTSLKKSIENIKISFISLYDILGNDGVIVSDISASLLSIPIIKRKPFATLKYRDNNSFNHIITYKSVDLSNEKWGNISNWNAIILDNDLAKVKNIAFTGIYNNRDEVKDNGIYRSQLTSSTQSILYVYNSTDFVYQTEIGQYFDSQGIITRSRKFDKNGLAWSDWQDIDIFELNNNVIRHESRLDSLKSDLIFVGKNLINKSSVVDGYISTSTGNITSNNVSYPNAKASSKIQVKSGTTYYLQGRTTGAGMVGYDNEGNKCIAIKDRIDYNSPINGSFVIADNVVSLQITLTLNGNDYDNIMLSESSSEQPYEDYIETNIKNIVSNNKNAIDDINNKLNNINNKLSNSQCYVRKESEQKISIYTQIRGNKYIHWGLIHDNNSEINADYWRLSTSYLSTKIGDDFSDNFDVLQYNENEYVFHIKNASDSTGGYHGDEKLLVFGLIINGIYKEFSEISNELLSCDTISYIEKSNMYNTALGDNSICAIHYKETVFEGGGYITKNRVVFQQNLILDSSYGGLVCMSKNVGGYFFADDLEIHQATGNDSTIYPNTKCGKICYYNDEKNISAVVESYIDYGYDENLLKLEIWDRAYDTKFYFRNKEDYNVSNGLDYKTTQKITFQIND